MANPFSRGLNTEYKEDQQKKLGLLDVFKKNYEEEDLKNELLESTQMDEADKREGNFEVELDFKERLQIIEDLTKKADEKDTIQLDRNIVTYCVLCLFKSNRRKFQLT